MLLKRIIGFSVIALAVLIRATYLEHHPPPPNIEDNLVLGALLLAPVTLLLSVIIFLGLGLFKRIKLSAQTVGFLCSVIGWTLIGLGIASVIIVGISAYYHSPQGPFSIVFLDGPLGAGMGTVIGLILWLKKVEWNYSS